jgi:HTH-type transcriptional regulator / antitoxin HipB
MNKKIKRALKRGDLVSFDKVFKNYSKEKKAKILKKARYLKTAIALRKLRKDLKLSQQKLADKMNVEREFISRIESGRQNITLETLHRVAEATNKKLDFCFK